jgi:predicted transcriptional regulator
LSRIKSNLGDTLKYLGITANKLAVESKTRTSTVHDVINNNFKAIKLDTLISWLDTLNNFSKQQDKDTITIIHILEYILEENHT